MKDTTTLSAAQTEAACPFGKIRDLYHLLCPSFPRIRSIDGERRKAVAARWRQYKSLGTFDELFGLAESSYFLKGQNDRNWHADFDWMVKATNFAKILEHKYHKEGRHVALVSHETVEETVRHYKITLEKGTNYFANGLPTGDRYNPKGITL